MGMGVSGALNPRLFNNGVCPAMTIRTLKSSADISRQLCGILGIGDPDNFEALTVVLNTDETITAVATCGGESIELDNLPKSEDVYFAICDTLGISGEALIKLTIILQGNDPVIIEETKYIYS